MLVVRRTEDPAVSVVIVAAVRPDRLVRCIEAIVREAPTNLALEIVVVLNAADDALRETLTREVTGTVIVNSNVPLGFAGGVNIGVRHARGKLLHVLHDDTKVCSGWLDHLLAALDDNPRAGAVGSTLLDPDGGLQSGGHVLWRDGRTEPRPTELLTGADGSYPVDYCASASILLRRDAWNAIGGLDEEFHPAYYVDVDMAMALRDRGYTVICEPRSHVCHARGGSAGRGFQAFVSKRNRERFTTKWADALLHQEPYAEDEDGRDRARRATELRATAITAAPTPIPPSSAEAQRGPESDEDRCRRELAQLRRDLAVKDAYIAQLEDVRAFADAELARRVEAQGRHEAEMAVAQRALAEYVARDAIYATRQESMDRELVRLRERDSTLAAVQAGGWWRLRDRLLRHRAAWAGLRQVIRRARSSRTE